MLHCQDILVLNHISLAALHGNYEADLKSVLVLVTKLVASSVFQEILVAEH